MVVAVWALGLSVGSAAEKDSAYRAALESIRAEPIDADLRWLADDKREGREAGSRGGIEAGRYLADQLARLRIRGVGDDGTYFQTFEPNYRNVLGWIEGSDPRLKNQVLVFGAHYDHVGYGTKQNSRGQVGQIHNGADDNASGDCAVLSLAQAFSMLSTPPRRSVLFAFWDAEEKGMLGSRYWTVHSTVPWPHVAMYMNFDMVGRLRDNHLVIFGSRTTYGIRRLLTTHNDGLLLDFPWTMLPNGDHYSFFNHGVPVLFFHTGLHDVYHSPRDKANLINTQGMQQLVRMVFAAAYELADREQAPAFRDSAPMETERVHQELANRLPTLPDRLGATCESLPATPGIRVRHVFPGQAADRASLRGGDRIVQFDGRPIRSADDWMQAISTAQGQATLSVERLGQQQSWEATVKLQGSPLRVGVVWRLDDAEPGTAVLTYVLPGSPAARAGLQADDRIYQAGGFNFSSDAELSRLLIGAPPGMRSMPGDSSTSPGLLPNPLRPRPGPVRVLIERKGELRVLEIPSEMAPLQRAA